MVRVRVCRGIRFGGSHMNITAMSRSGIAAVAGVGITGIGAYEMNKASTMHREADADAFTGPVGGRFLLGVGALAGGGALAFNASLHTPGLGAVAGGFFGAALLGATVWAGFQLGAAAGHSAGATAPHSNQ